MYISKQMYICLHIPINVYISTCTYIHIHIHTYVHMFICTYVHMYVYTYVYVIHAYIRLCMYISVHVLFKLARRIGRSRFLSGGRAYKGSFDIRLRPITPRASFHLKHLDSFVYDPARTISPDRPSSVFYTLVFLIIPGSSSPSKGLEVSLYVARSISPGSLGSQSLKRFLLAGFAPPTHEPEEMPFIIELVFPACTIPTLVTAADYVLCRCWIPNCCCCGSHHWPQQRARIKAARNLRLHVEDSMSTTTTSRSSLSVIFLRHLLILALTSNRVVNSSNFRFWTMLNLVKRLGASWSPRLPPPIRSYH